MRSYNDQEKSSFIHGIIYL